MTSQDKGVQGRQTWTSDEIREICEKSEPYNPRLSEKWILGGANSNAFLLANAAWWQTEGCRQMQCRHEILRHELVYAPSLFMSDSNYRISYIGLKAQNVYQELENCLKIIWFADNNIPVSAFFKTEDQWLDVPEELKKHYKFARVELGHEIFKIFGFVSSVSQNMLRCAYNKLKTEEFCGIFSNPEEDYESSLDSFLDHINNGRIPTNYFVIEGLGKIPQSNLKLMLTICVFCRDYLGRKWGYAQP